MRLRLFGIEPRYIPRLYSLGLVVVYNHLPYSEFESGGGPGNLKGNKSMLESTVKTEPDLDSVEAEIREALHHSIRRGLDEF